MSKNTHRGVWPLCRALSTGRDHTLDVDEVAAGAAKGRDAREGDALRWVRVGGMPHRTVRVGVRGGADGEGGDPGLPHPLGGRISFALFAPCHTFPHWRNGLRSTT